MRKNAVTNREQHIVQKCMRWRLNVKMSDGLMFHQQFLHTSSDNL